MEEEDKIPSSNTFFAVEGTMQPTAAAPPEDFMPSILDWETKEFSTTNILKQNQKRKELIKFVKNEPLAQASAGPTVNPATSLRPTQSGRSASAGISPSSTPSPSSGGGSY